MRWMYDLANITLIASYSVRDILWLRVFAVICGGLQIPYFYMQPRPLWDPIYWASSFMALNLFWIVLLLIERRPVTLSPEQQHLHRLVFRTLSPREMLQLLKFAQWEDKAKGEIVAAEDQEQNRLSVIVSGRAEVRMHDRRVSEIGAGQFAGNISFVTQEVAPIFIVALEPVRQVSWPKDELRKFLKGRIELTAALELVLAFDLGVELQRSWSHQAGGETTS